MTLKEKIKKTWMNENSPKSQLMSTHIRSLKPDIGFLVTVDNLEIPENIFNEEYNTIVKAYESVLKKLNIYYHENHF